VLVLDITIVTVVLPATARTRLPAAELQWLVTSYALTFEASYCSPILGGRVLHDR
jgi:hypothetical protein